MKKEAALIETRKMVADVSENLKIAEQRFKNLVSQKEKSSERTLEFMELIE